MSASPPATTWRRVLARRLRRHHLTGPPADDAVALARRVVGVQAQVPSVAEQAMAVRGPAASSVRAALADGSLVRTWSVRGTLHLLAADQAPAVLAAVGAARSWEKGAWQREFASAAQVAELAASVADLLPGRSLTREELVAELSPRVDPVLAARLSSGWGTVLKPLAWQGLLVNGEPRGGRPTFTSPATWCPGWTGLPTPDVAARRVVPAYLDAYGPASPETFDAWLLRGATPRATLRRWFAELVDDGTLTLVEVHDDHGGSEPEVLHARTADLDDLCGDASDRCPEDADDADGPVRLLPAFDPWVLGPGTTDPRVVPPEHRPRVSRAAGWIAPVVIRAGRVVATWADGDAAASSGPSLEPFPGERPVPARVVDAEYGRFREAVDAPGQAAT